LSLTTKDSNANKRNHGMQYSQKNQPDSGVSIRSIVSSEATLEMSSTKECKS